MELRDSGALVAGGASGLGAATARALAERGARVAIADLNEEAASALADELGGVAFKADVTDEHGVKAAVDGAVEAFGGLRFAVSCARPRSLETMRWKASFARRCASASACAMPFAVRGLSPWPWMRASTFLCVSPWRITMKRVIVIPAETGIHSPSPG